ncbi:MAG: hypothetical protein UT89_C0009G0006 [Parcubacteria group bacterium GW2011_GWE1_40_20]|nr:MAG: hypothetical protein UT89_C0009G0006 [Parcubacteria group bacterium GW2011_GWE1_40_20]
MENSKNIEKLLLAILALLVDRRESASKDGQEKSRNIEVILADIGLSGPEIAKIVNKNLAAVQKTIQRGHKKQ